MKALIVIDIQNGASQRNDLFNKTEFLEKVNSAITFFEKKDLPIFYIQHNNKNLVANTLPWQIDERVRRREPATIVQKFHGDAFTETNLKEMLRSKGIDEILTCGLVSNGCVKFTCLGGLREGFKVSLLKNGHSTLGKDAEQKIARSEKELLAAGISIVDDCERFLYS